MIASLLILCCAAGCGQEGLQQKVETDFANNWFATIEKQIAKQLIAQGIKVTKCKLASTDAPNKELSLIVTFLNETSGWPWESHCVLTGEDGELVGHLMFDLTGEGKQSSQKTYKATIFIPHVKLSPIEV